MINLIATDETVGMVVWIIVHFVLKNTHVQNKILGAAIEEGSLKPGDRLLEVNGTTVDGMAQSEVVALLRNAPRNSVLNLLVSRHVVNAEDQNTLTRPQTKVMKTEGEETESKTITSELQTENKSEPNQQRSLSTPSTDHYESYDENFTFPWKQREILTFDIPVHDSERAGKKKKVVKSRSYL